MKTKAKPPTAPTARTLLRPDEFAGSPREWLAEDVLVAGSPAVVAGGRVELTWFAADLAVSLATGSPFLGRFAARRRRTALCCYGSAFADVRAIVHAVATARGTDLAASELRLARQGPAFRSPAEGQAAVAEMRDEGVEVVILDPVQCALRAGERSETDTEVDRLATVGDAFLAAGITPVFAHGTRWPSDTPRLTDLGALGLRDYARQWVLLDRPASAKKAGSGTFRLTASGFAGHAGEWCVKANPGRLQPNFGGLKWDVAVTDDPGRSDEPRRGGMVATAEDVETIYAELEATAAAKRGQRLTGGKAATPAQPGSPAGKASSTAFSFA